MKRRGRRIGILAGLLFGLWSSHAAAQFEDPFRVEARRAGNTVRVEVGIPPGHYLYADQFAVTDGAGHPLPVKEAPTPATMVDPIEGKSKQVFDRSFTAVYDWRPSPEGKNEVRVRYQGCNHETCFFPQEKIFRMTGETEEAAVESTEEALPIAGWRAELEHFKVMGSRSGYMKSAAFLDFLDRAEKGCDGCGLKGWKLFLSDPGAFVKQSGMLLTLLLILLGGVALNLTPCVLPMIPVNLAIIGAGAAAGSRRRGFLLGAAYGTGIALTYGLLGAVAVLTGSRFGTLQAGPWFNLAIAFLFLVLGLAMFDLFHIDLSRWQNKLGGGKTPRSGSFIAALAMGSVAALLAGACVAPVVIAVLLLAAHLGPAGILLPFVLGVGMGLPWALAGAGLACLPKPGKWMVYVKYLFGVIILLLAFYYGHLSYRAFHPETPVSRNGAKGYVEVDGATNEGFAEALRRAYRERRPVLIDFGAEWCKNCLAMERSTFQDAEVKKRLKRYVFIKYRAEDLNNPNTRAVMDWFRVPGLPTFVVLIPQEKTVPKKERVGADAGEG